MRIRRLTAYIVRLPLKRAFAHASATRSESENVLVCCELVDGTTGWGEGVPRSYVTGETPEGCLAQLAATPVDGQLAAESASWSDTVRLCESFAPAGVQEDPRGCYGNALQCAVELSILDAFGRLFGEPVSNVIGHYAPAAAIEAKSHSVRYSAVIDAGSEGLLRKALVRRLYGFRHCKVKVGHPGDVDAARLRTIRRVVGRGMDLRVDANEAWPASQLRVKTEPLVEFNISCLEQPVPHAEVSGLTELRRQVGIPIMLDESLTSMADAKVAIDEKTCDLFNIRLSKCGGFLSSLRIAAAAHAAGVGYQLGCHPGETGILSAAGRHWATSVAGVRYAEGCYDRYLFRRLLTNEDMTFGYGGKAPSLKRAGLGVTINPSVLADVTIKQQSFTID
jgi:muconate cycloisomerase